jgi:hypothetical protein
MTSRPKSTADIIIFLSRVAALGSFETRFLLRAARHFFHHLRLDNPKNLNPKSNSHFQ